MNAMVLFAAVRRIKGAPSPSPAPAPASMFPIAIHASKRYLVDASGNPVYLNGDTPWSLAVQLSPTQVDTYLDDRQTRGFNAVIFEAVEHYFSSQTPFYANYNGDTPFTGMAHSSVDFTAFNEAYWTHVDYIYEACLARSIVPFIFPAYLGFGGGGNSANDQGWDTAVNNATDQNLFDYGALLATRYPNAVFPMGGDFNPATPAKQWNIAEGVRSVDASAMLTGHGARNSSGYSVWNAVTPAMNLNNIYCDVDGVSYDDAETEYARAGPLPFFFIEGGYGQAQSDEVCRRQLYQAVLGGACGFFGGRYNLWGFGEPHANGGAGAAAALASDLDTVDTIEQGHANDLFTTYAPYLMAPSNGTGLVTSSLSTGTSRVCPALASDGSFALIYVPSSQSVTVDMSALTPASVRARLFDPTTGTYSAVSGSPFANSGTQSIATGGERVIVLDAA